MGTATTLNTCEDVVTYLKKQHNEIKSLFAAMVSARGEARVKTFNTLRKLMAVHETAEEEIIHPTARRDLPNGDMIVDARLFEEKKAKTVLAELEKLDMSSPEFATKLAALEKDVLAHAASEEAEEFARLAAKLDARRLARMRRAVELAEAIAPTHPHAGVESAVANIIVGPFASMLDRARDAITGEG